MPAQEPLDASCLILRASIHCASTQAYAPYIKVGALTYVTLQEFPGQKFSAKVARTAESIDPNTRTLLTEVDVPNRDGRLLPGSFGEVHFAVGSNVNKVTVPVNAMLFRAEGPRLAIVDSSHQVRLRPINIGNDYGATLEILAGVSREDQVIINPSDSLEEGQQVNVAAVPTGENAPLRYQAGPKNIRENENARERQTNSQGESRR